MAGAPKRYSRGGQIQAEVYAGGGLDFSDPTLPTIESFSARTRIGVEKRAFDALVA
jgi:hypothetical protein